MEKTTKTLIIVISCILVFAGGYLFLRSYVHSPALESSKNILYWVDPMEPQIHYEGPGKSRMNMDLIPVYAEGAQDGSQEKSAPIKISPSVINNLGVRTAIVEEGDLNPTLKLFGMIKVDEDKIIHIHSYAEGWIQKLYVKKPQEFVEKDQPLFEIYSRELRLAQREYLLRSTGDLKQNEELSAGKLRSLGVSEKQIDQLRRTGKDNPLVTIYAPEKGYIESLNIREGMWVKPEITILGIADISEVWVIADVFPAQRAFIKLGEDATIFLPQSPNKTWQGKIEYIYPEVDPVSLTLKVRIRLPNPDLFFKPNMYVGVDVKGTSKQILKIPKEAVIWAEGGQNVIIALEGGRFESRKVTTGDEDGNNIEILSGLKKGEKVVTSAQFLIDSEVHLKSALQRLDRASTSSEQSHAEGHGS